MIRQFYKLHGIGNDYIYFDCFDEELPNPEQLAVRLSDRHRSIGGDGIILICRSAIADAKMRMFNADGSEGKMCGNGIRCVGKFLYDVKGIRKQTLTVETLSGVKTLQLHTENGQLISITVDMGKAFLATEDIPALFEGDKIVDRSLVVGDEEYKVTCVSMGNPHCIVFDADPDEIDLDKIGRKFETHAVFPERVNTEFVKVLARNELKMRVWERGSGETLACGTGACAVAVAAVLNGFCDENADIRVRLPGGELIISYKNGSVYMTGPAELAYIGTVDL